MNYREMMTEARKHGLENEVNYSYGVCLMAIGTDTPAAEEQAAQEALREWDID